MGNSQLQKSSFEQHNWKSIQQTQNKRILYNDMSMRSVERHEAQLDCDEGEAISMCKWRESLPQDSCVVDLYQFGIKKAGMCNKQSKLYVITQRIHLLSEIGAVSRPQAFLILRNIATGLKILFRKFGNFDPKPNLMGINSEGKAKVWTNQNFAISEPQKNSNIQITSSESEIMNNVIKILEQKTLQDNRFPIDFPKNLDLSLVIGYVNKVFNSLNGFEVDRVYIDRTQFAKKYKQLKQRQQWEQKSKIFAQETQKKVFQIQQLHQNLRMHQIQLAKRERQLRLQASQAQVQRQLQIYRQVEAQRLFEIQRQINPSVVLNQHHNEGISENSQGKILKRTVSTIRSEAFNSRVHSNTHEILNQAHQIKNNQMQGRPPLPPKQINQTNPLTFQNLNTNTSSHQNYNQQRIKKDIQLVDSMVMMREQMAVEPDKNLVESRIVTYQI